MPADRSSRNWTGELYEAIAEAGFSTRGFARRMNVHRSTLWRIENGLITPSQEFTDRAETLLDLPSKTAVAA